MKRHYPAIKNATFMLIFFTIFSVVFYILLMGLASITKIAEPRDMSAFLNRYPILVGLFNLATLGLMSFWVFKKAKVPFDKIFPLKKVHILLIIPLTFLTIGLHIMNSEIDNLLRILMHAPVKPDDFFVKLVGGNVFVSIFVMMIIAPLTEEFLFRGAFLTGFINNYSVKKAILASAILFGLFHLNLYQFFSAFILGVVAAFLVIKTNSLWPGIYCHMLGNGLPILVDKFLKFEIPGYNGPQQLVMQPIWFDGIGLALVGLGVGVLLPMIRRGLEVPPELTREVEPEIQIVAAEGSDFVITPPQPKQGIISLIIGIFSFISYILIIALVAVFFVVLHHRPSYLWNMIIGLLALIGFFGCMVGLGFGIVGIIKKSKYNIVGTVINGFIFVITVCALLNGILKK